MPPSSPSNSAVPTRARHVTLAFALALAVITYIDRVCIGQAMPVISTDLALSRPPCGGPV